MNLTLSAEDELVEKARLAAQRQGTSLNDLVRQYLRSLAGETSGPAAGKELLALMQKQGGHSGGGLRTRRDDIYAERLKTR